MLAVKQIIKSQYLPLNNRIPVGRKTGNLSALPRQLGWVESGGIVSVRWSIQPNPSCYTHTRVYLVANLTKLDPIGLDSTQDDTIRPNYMRHDSTRSDRLEMTCLKTMRSNSTKS